MLISTYDLGHQPFGLASPAAWLRSSGIETTSVDLAVQDLDTTAIRRADLVAIYVPMHTATRLAAGVIGSVRELNPDAHLCAYGLYAAMNETYLRELGVDSFIGGEFEQPLLNLAERLRDRRSAATAGVTTVSLDRQQFRIPDRSDLPVLSSYGVLRLPDGQTRTVGYTEATRGCKHECRHCPIVPVYGGRFRVVQRDVVLADLAAQVAAGAEHITFGDPDFFNGPAHATALVRALHERFPEVTYDVTIKVEHLVRHADLLPVLRETGCVLVTSAVEAFDDRLLTIFDKRHSRSDFETAIRLLEENGIGLNPTFVPFTPWTTVRMYVEFLTTVREFDMVSQVAPVQYAIRLLIPEGSLLLTLPETHAYLTGFDSEALCHRWIHPDPRMDALQSDLFALVAETTGTEQSRTDVFDRICELTATTLGPGLSARLNSLGSGSSGKAVPYFSEPWFCCAEPLERRLAPQV